MDYISGKIAVWVSVVIFCIIGYLLGSISFAVIFSKAFTGKDVREQGSGNAGMTNVMRTSGKLPGILTFLCDFLKGTISVILAKELFLPVANFLAYFVFGPLIDGTFVYYENIVFNGAETYLNPRIVSYIVAIFCMLGHIFPIFFKFKGGKGVATIVGTAAAFSPFTALVCFTFFIIMTLCTKIVSISSILAVTLAVPVNYLFYVLLYNDGTYIWFGSHQALASTILVAIMSGMVIIKHHENIKRLLNGTENKIGSGKKG